MSFYQGFGFSIGTALFVASVLGGCALFEKMSGGNTERSNNEVVFSLQKKVEDHERRIAELTGQLILLRHSDRNTGQANIERKDDEVILSLHQRVKERDRQIAELKEQLDLLKRIDREMTERRKSSRSPVPSDIERRP
jgi:hypothetical protein